MKIDKKLLPKRASSVAIDDIEKLSVLVDLSPIIIKESIPDIFSRTPYQPKEEGVNNVKRRLSLKQLADGEALTNQDILKQLKEAEQTKAPKKKEKITKSSKVKNEKQPLKNNINNNNLFNHVDTESRTCGRSRI